MHKKLGIVVSSLALATTFGLAGMSSAMATPHGTEDLIPIVGPFPTPTQSTECGEAGLHMEVPGIEDLPYILEQRLEEGKYVAKPGYKFVGAAPTFTVHYTYKPCEDDESVEPVESDPVGSIDPGFLIVTQPEAPCVLPNGIAPLPSATNEYGYGYTATSVIAIPFVGKEFQQDLIVEWPLADIVAPCPVVEDPAPVVEQPVSAPVEAVPAAEAPASVPVATAPKPVVKPAETVSDAPAVPLANVGVNAEANLPNQLAYTASAEAKPAVNPAVFPVVLGFLVAGVAAVLLTRLSWLVGLIKK